MFWRFILIYRIKTFNGWNYCLIIFLTWRPFSDSKWNFFTELVGSTCATYICTKGPLTARAVRASLSCIVHITCTRRVDVAHKKREISRTYHQYVYACVRLLWDAQTHLFHRTVAFGVYFTDVINFINIFT